MSDSPLVSKFLRKTFGPSADGAPDAELLARFRDSGDQTAFECLVWRHLGLVLRTARQIVRDAHLAEDVAQSVFLSMARWTPTLRNQSLVGWLHVVACRAAVKAIDKRWKNTEAAMDMTQFAAKDSEGEIPGEGRYVHEEVARLPEKYRLPILLCFYQGYTQIEAAERLGWPLGTLATRVTNAKKLLEKRLARRGVAAAGLLLGMIGKESATASAPFVTGTIRASMQFAANELVGSELARALAKECYQNHFSTRAVTVFAVIATITVGTGFAVIPNEAPNHLPNPKLDSLTQHVLAPRPATRKPKPIDQDVIKTFAVHGAVPGVFVFPEGEGQMPEFQANAKLGEWGLPGFRFTEFPDEVPDRLPEIGVPYGLILEGDVPDAWLRLLVKSDQIRVLQLVGGGSYTSTFLQSLGESPSLEYARFETPDCDAVTLQVLGRCHDLKVLSLSQSGITNPDLKHLSELSRLVTLDISGTSVSGAGLRDHLAKLEKLEHIYFEGIDMSEVKLEDVFGGRKMKTIRHEPDVLDDDAAIYLGGRKLLHSLAGAHDSNGKRPRTQDDVVHLSLQNSPISSKGFAEFYTLKRLETLQLGGTQIGPESGITDRFPALRRLELPSTWTEEVIEKLLENDRLARIELLPNQLTDRVVCKALKLGRLHRLSPAFGSSLPPSDDKIQILNLMGSRISCETLTRLFAELREMQLILVDGPSMTEELVQFLLERKMFHKVQWCSSPTQELKAMTPAQMECLNQARIPQLEFTKQRPKSDRAITHIRVLTPLSAKCWKSMLSTAERLEAIDLVGHNVLDENAVAAIDEADKFHTLNIVRTQQGARPVRGQPFVLQARSCNLTPRNLWALSRVKSLARIDDAETRLTGPLLDAWIQSGLILKASFATGENGPPEKLEEITSFRVVTQFDDAALDTLSRLKGLKKLELVGVPPNSLSEKKLEEFAKILPNCKVERVTPPEPPGD